MPFPPHFIEFINQKGEIRLKLEFITSFNTSDDTLNRFLGKELACNRIETFELLLDMPMTLEIEHQKRKMLVNVPEPATFLFHKGISFVMRGDDYKRDKDLFYVYFILRNCPYRELLLQRLKDYKNHELFSNFRGNLKNYLKDYSQRGYRMIKRFLSQYEDERTVYREIKGEISELLKL